MIDPDLQYCPQCGDEYRADIITCAACNLSLVSGGQRLLEEEQQRAVLENRPGVISEGDEVVTIYRGSLVDLKHMETVLGSERIGCLVIADEQSCGKGCCPSHFNLQVRRQDVQHALALVKEVYRQSIGLGGQDTDYAEVVDLDQAEATCPACGHSFATTSTTCPDCGLCMG